VSPLLSAYLLDWAAMLLRWLHVVAGIAWIGASFYFVWLDNQLQPPVDGASADPRLAGELWSVHGGGFYRSQKYRVAPAVLPPKLHWFYWEAYTTWLTGFGLLCLLYLLRAEVYLIDPSVAHLSKPQAIAIALGFLAGGWLFYDGLCRSPLGRRPRWLALVISAALALAAWGLCHLFSGRGAFMVFGAMLGSIMVANVLFVIIPGQRELVRAKQQGREPDPIPGMRGKQRSVHNTYFTLPVLFVMISNHYAMTYGARHNWLILIALSFAGASLRAWFVERQKAESRGTPVPLLPAALGIAALFLTALVLAPRHTAMTAGIADPMNAAVGIDLSANARADAAGPIDRDAVEHIVHQRCSPCHSTVPTEAGFAAPPNGLVFERLSQLSPHLSDVQTQLSTRAMPPGNLTALTEGERTLLLRWVAYQASRQDIHLEAKK